MPAFEWGLAAGLWTLLVPLAVLLLSLRRQRAAPVPLGTHALWAADAQRGGTRTAPRVPLARWLWVLSLVAFCLALAEPRWRVEEDLVPLTVVVDRSPSLYLEHTRADGVATGRGSRLDAALEDLQGMLRGTAGEGFDRERLRWREWNPGAFQGGSGESSPVPGGFPEAWRRAPDAARHPSTEALREREAFLTRFDLEGVVWLTDRLDREPQRAGWVTSGGGPAFGPVAETAEGQLVWDGQDVVEVPGPKRRVRLDPDLPAAVRDLAVAWAEVRGFRTGEEPGDESRGSGASSNPGESGGEDVTLWLRAVEGLQESESVVCGREGWEVSGPSVAVPADHLGLPLRSWLRAEAPEGERTVVGWAPGVIYVGLAAAPPRGDPAAFAVSWSHLFDEARRVSDGVLPLAWRGSVEPADRRPPRLPSGPAEPAGSGREARELRPWCALAALLLGLGALTLKGARLR